MLQNLENCFYYICFFEGKLNNNKKYSNLHIDFVQNHHQPLWLSTQNENHHQLLQEVFFLIMKTYINKWVLSIFYYLCFYLFHLVYLYLLHKLLSQYLIIRYMLRNIFCKPLKYRSVYRVSLGNCFFFNVHYSLNIWATLVK